MVRSLAALLCGGVAAFCLEQTLSAADLAHPAETLTTTLYHEDPQHVWNRLHVLLRARVGPDGQTYGLETVDVLVWENSKRLLSDEEFPRLTNTLDEFLSTAPDVSRAAPLARALLQRDLWAVFDWTSMPSIYDEVARGKMNERARALQRRLALAIRRIALTPAEAEALPDNYAAAVAAALYPLNHDSDDPLQPFLPGDIFEADGPWVCVSADAHGLGAPVHVRDFATRSAFLIFMRTPGGRAETLDYLHRLAEFAEPWIYNKASQPAARDPHRAETGNGPWSNPATP